MWKYDSSRIDRLTRQEVIDAFNTVTKSPVLGYPTDFRDMLGDIERNATGHVVGAKFVRLAWATQWDPNEKIVVNPLIGLDHNIADRFTMEWESLLQERMEEMRQAYEDDDMGYTMFYFTSRRYIFDCLTFMHAPFKQTFTPLVLTTSPRIRSSTKL